MISPKRTPACAAGPPDVTSRMIAPLALARPSEIANGRSRTSVLAPIDPFWGSLATLPTLTFNLRVRPWGGLLGGAGVATAGGGAGVATEGGGTGVATEGGGAGVATAGGGGGGETGGGGTGVATEGGRTGGETEGGGAGGEMAGGGCTAGVAGGWPPVGGRGGMRTMLMPESAALLNKDSPPNVWGRGSGTPAPAGDTPGAARPVATTTREAREPPPARQLMDQSPKGRETPRRIAIGPG